MKWYTQLVILLDSRMSTTYSPLHNVINGLLMVIVSFPSLYMGYLVHCNCVYAPTGIIEDMCVLGVNRPIVFVNLIFLLFVCVLFWIISLVQNSTWLIDPYWTIIPPLIGIFYHYHPHAHGNQVRSWIGLGLTFIWSTRLTHSYFRRENFCFGEREDWRFTKMKLENPKIWWWLSFFAAFLSQQPMLVGITLPLWAINLHPNFDGAVPLGFIDVIATVGCILGIIIAYFADTQLRQFMLMNEERSKKGLTKELILRTGVWKYSRHPNYFGEQLWWWSLALFSLPVNQPWTFIGTAFNTAIMMQVTNLTETRMLSDPKRKELFRKYQKETSVWIPWPPLMNRNAKEM